MGKVKFLLEVASACSPLKKGETVKVSATDDGILIETVGLPKRSALLPYRKMVEYKAYEAVRRERVKRSTFWRSFFGALTLGHFGAALGWASSQKPGDDRWAVWNRVAVHYVPDRGITTCFSLKSVGDAGELELEKEILRNAPFAAFLKNGEFGQLRRHMTHESAACGMTRHALPRLAARV